MKILHSTEPDPVQLTATAELKFAGVVVLGDGCLRGWFLGAVVEIVCGHGR